MFKFRLILLSISLLTSVFQRVNGQDYLFKPLNNTLTDIEYFSDSVRILFGDENILYLNSDGFLTAKPSILSKHLQENFEIQPLQGGVSVSKTSRFNYLLKGKSIRFIGENFIATYDGIFKKTEKFSNLTYSNGTVREIGDSIIAAWDGLTIFYGDSIYDYTSYDTINTYINGRRLGFTKDVISLNGRLILLTTTGIYDFHPGTNQLSTILEKDNQRIQFFDQEFSVTGKVQSITLGIDMLRVRILNDGNFFVTKTYPEAFSHYNAIQNILVLPNQIEDQPGGRIFNVPNNYHCVFKIDELYFGASDSGLFVNAESTSPQQLNAIEYNARSFRISNDTVLLGSVNGLYEYPFDYLLKKANAAATPSGFSLETNVIAFVSLIVLILVGFIVLLVFLNTKIGRVLKTSTPEVITKSVLMEYIHSNIHEVSIASLCHEFDLSQKELYNYFPESSPGAVIKNLRLLKAQNLFKEGKNTDIIAQETGYSKKYLSQTILPQLR
tara:strand:+ start:10661 stop:12151 length:1491 start_codon:yes stop_codon:yes gene_type:complete